MKPIYDWNAEEFSALCTLTDRNEVFYGFATAHPNDQDLANEYTGLHIAENRALIKALQHRKNYVLTPGLKSLKHLYYSMKQSTHFNSKSYEAKMLNRQIQQYEDDIEATKQMIAEIKKHLKEYIEGKDSAYKKTRKRMATQNLPLDETV